MGKNRHVIVIPGYAGVEANMGGGLGSFLPDRQRGRDTSRTQRLLRVCGGLAAAGLLAAVVVTQKDKLGEICDTMPVCSEAAGKPLGPVESQVTVPSKTDPNVEISGLASYMVDPGRIFKDSTGNILLGVGLTPNPQAIKDANILKDGQAPDPSAISALAYTNSISTPEYQDACYRDMTKIVDQAKNHAAYLVRAAEINYGGNPDAPTYLTKAQFAEAVNPYEEKHRGKLLPGQAAVWVTVEDPSHVVVESGGGSSWLGGEQPTAQEFQAVTALMDQEGKPRPTGLSLPAIVRCE